MCHLYPRKDLFTPTFRLVIVDGSRKRVVDDFDKEQFLVGTCEGKVSVSIYLLLGAMFELHYAEYMAWF